VKLKLDENLGRSAAALLRQAGHDVATVAEQELWGTPDRELIKICLTERRCLVTLDMDFGNPLLFNPPDYAGIAVLRLPPRPSMEDLLETIRTIIGGMAKESIEGRLWIVQRGRIRAYQPEE
jgi:predicted nuclease of predicted toxin-antitoxin system